ncbi:MAG TPA: hypothetical protein VF380_10350 [Solirubrobacteraceae bacterium]
MAQISRPFQIAFVGVLALAAVWLFALHGRSTSSSTESSSVPATPAVKATAAPSGAQGSGGTTSVYHGSAPGVAGLSNAIAKAHGAASTSEQNTKAVEQKSSDGSAAPAATAPAAAAPSAAAAPAVTKVTKVTSGTTTATVVTKAPAHKATGTAHAVVGAPANQRMVEADLKAGKVAVLLFWDPRGADDRAVQRQLLLLERVHHRLAPFAHNPTVQRLNKAFGLDLTKKIAVHRALTNQVASFGSVTRGVQVYGTPTILVIGKAGQATTMTGFADAFGIEQAIDEARP